MKATMSEARSAFAAMTRLFEETKLGQDAAWSVARMLRKVKGHVKDFERAQQKLYIDAGGISDGRGLFIPAIDREKDESLTQWEARLEAYRNRTNQLAKEMEGLNDREVEIDLTPILISSLPKERKNDKGEKEEIVYRATDLANAWPFISDEKG